MKVIHQTINWLTRININIECMSEWMINSLMKVIEVTIAMKKSWTKNVKQRNSTNIYKPSRYLKDDRDII
jgi:hypothetical protein